jgi:hypothetical protein
MRITSLTLCFMLLLFGCSDDTESLSDSGVTAQDSNSSGTTLPACASQIDTGDTCTVASFAPCYVEGPHCGASGFNDRFRTCVCKADKVDCDELMPSDGESCSQLPVGKSCTTGELMAGGYNCTCGQGFVWNCTYYPPGGSDAGTPDSNTGNSPLPACTSEYSTGDTCATGSFAPCYVEGFNCGASGFSNPFRTCTCKADKVDCDELMPSDGESCSQIPIGKSCTTGELYAGGYNCTCETGFIWDCTYYPPGGFDAGPG